MPRKVTPILKLIEGKNVLKDHEEIKRIRRVTEKTRWVTVTGK